MWRMYCVCLLSVIVVLDLLGQSHVNRNSCDGWRAIDCELIKLTKSSSQVLLSLSQERVAVLSAR